MNRIYNRLQCPVVICLFSLIPVLSSSVVRQIDQFERQHSNSPASLVLVAGSVNQSLVASLQLPVLHVDAKGLTEALQSLSKQAKFGMIIHAR